MAQTSSIQCLLALTRALLLLPGGYDGNDVEFSWLRGNDSVRGLENLRLAQYTIQRYFTLVTGSQQETGNAWDKLYESKITESEIASVFRFTLWGPRSPSAVGWGGRAWNWPSYLLRTQDRNGPTVQAHQPSCCRRDRGSQFGGISTPVNPTRHNSIFFPENHSDSS